MPGFRVTPHAIARFRERVLPAGTIAADQDIRDAIVAGLGGRVTFHPSPEGTGTVARVSGALRFAAVLAQGSGDWTDVVTVMPRLKGRGNRDRKKLARREARLAAAAPDGTALLVTARLLNGFVTSDPWSPALDGLLAAALMQERLGDDYVVSALRPSAMRPVEGLPLAVVAHGDLWWYACSSPIVDAPIRERRHFHRRFDEAEAVDRLAEIRRVADAAGPYKAYRLPETRIVVPEVTWHAIGEAGEVHRLLARIPAIGAGRARGHGEVVEWVVTDRGDADTARRHRPLPVAYAEAHGIVGERMLAGLRPPARLPCNVVECVVPRRSAAVRAA